MVNLARRKSLKFLLDLLALLPAYRNRSPARSSLDTCVFSYTSSSEPLGRKSSRIYILELLTKLFFVPFLPSKILKNLLNVRKPEVATQKKEEKKSSKIHIRFRSIHDEKEDSNRKRADTNPKRILFVLCKHTKGILDRGPSQKCVNSISEKTQIRLRGLIVSFLMAFLLFHLHYAVVVVFYGLFPLLIQVEHSRGGGEPSGRDSLSLLQ
jgi:hypothetical protein